MARPAAQPRADDCSIGLPVDPRSSIIGAAAGYLSLWSVYHVFQLLTGKEGMGYGDFKLFAALGAWLGWQMLLLIILLSAFTGAVIGILMIALRGRDRNIPIPFGPYLAAAGWIALMWGDELVASYLHFAGVSSVAMTDSNERHSPADRTHRRYRSGKTAVAELFAKLGVPVLDTDQIARDVVAPGMPALGSSSRSSAAKSSTRKAGSTARACASACSAIRSSGASWKRSLIRRFVQSSRGGRPQPAATTRSTSSRCSWRAVAPKPTTACWSSIVRRRRRSRA